MDIAQEMMEDAIEANDDEDMDDEVDEKVDAVLYEITQGQLGKIGVSVKNKKLIVPKQKTKVN